MLIFVTCYMQHVTTQVKGDNMAVVRASQEAYKRILLAASKDGLSIEAGLDRLLGELDREVEKQSKELAQAKEELAKKPKEVVKTVEIPVEKIVEKRVEIEVPIEKIVEKRIEIEVPVEKIIYKDKIVEVPVDREVIKEVEVEKIVYRDTDCPVCKKPIKNHKQEHGSVIFHKALLCPD